MVQVVHEDPSFLDHPKGGNDNNTNLFDDSIHLFLGNLVNLVDQQDQQGQYHQLNRVNLVDPIK